MNNKKQYLTRMYDATTKFINLCVGECNLLRSIKTPFYVNSELKNFKEFIILDKR